MLTQIDYATHSESQRRVRDLFQNETPNRAILQSFLAGNTPGKLFVDDKERPTRAVVRADFLGWTFLGGTFEPRALASELEPISMQQDLSLIGNFDQTEPYAKIFSAQTMPRLQFENVDHELLRKVSPLGNSKLTIRVANSQQFDSCIWKELMILGYGTKESFLKNGKVFQMLVDDTCVSETYLTFPTNGISELGAITVEDARGNGYAFELVRHVIESARTHSTDTMWSCDVDNPGSIALARKLCFRTIRPYNIYYVEKTK